MGLPCPDTNPGTHIHTPHIDRQTDSMQQQQKQQPIHAPPPPSASTHHAPSAMASAIHWAATKGDLRTLRQLVEFEGVDPSAKDASSHHCETPLFRAAGANHTKVCYIITLCCCPSTHARIHQRRHPP